MNGGPQQPRCWRGGLRRKVGRTPSLPSPQPQTSPPRDREAGVSHGSGGLTFGWFLTLPLLILGHSSWMLSPCPVFHELSLSPQCSPVDCGEGRCREPWGRASPPPATHAPTHPGPELLHTPTDTLCPGSVWEQPKSPPPLQAGEGSPAPSDMTSLRAQGASVSAA